MHEPRGPSLTLGDVYSEQQPALQARTVGPGQPCLPRTCRQPQSGAWTVNPAKPQAGTQGLLTTGDAPTEPCIVASRCTHRRHECLQVWWAGPNRDEEGTVKEAETGQVSKEAAR